MTCNVSFRGISSVSLFVRYKMIKQFFEESKEQSQIKSRIVSKYFWAWARIIRTAVRNSGHPRILYLDLFAGPGRYEDGTRSTPLLILEKAVEDPDARQMLVTIFNDSDPENTGSARGRNTKVTRHREVEIQAPHLDARGRARN